MSANNDSSPVAPPQETASLDLEAQSRQSMQAVGNLIERITPWLFAFGSWVFGGLIAFNLLVIASLITVGPVRPAILVASATLACALPLNVAGLFVLKLIPEMKEAGIDEHMRQTFQEVGFPMEIYIPQEHASLHRRRTRITLSYAVSILLFSLTLALAGMVAALWYLAWWVGVIFLVMVLVSLALVIIVFTHTLPPMSEEEKEHKRRYKEQRIRQKQDQRKAEQIASTLQERRAV